MFGIPTCLFSWTSAKIFGAGTHLRPTCAKIFSTVINLCQTCAKNFCAIIHFCSEQELKFWHKCRLALNMLTKGCTYFASQGMRGFKGSTFMQMFWCLYNLQSTNQWRGKAVGWHFTINKFCVRCGKLILLGYYVATCIFVNECCFGYVLHNLHDFLLWIVFLWYRKHMEWKRLEFHYNG